MRARLDCRIRWRMTFIRLTARGPLLAQGHEDAIGLLLKQGAHVNIRDDKGWTPLMAAAAEGHAKVVELLAGRGCSVSERSESGSTALELAAARGREDVIEVSGPGGGGKQAEGGSGLGLVIAG